MDCHEDNEQDGCLDCKGYANVQTTECEVGRYRYATKIDRIQPFVFMSR